MCGARPTVVEHAPAARRAGGRRLLPALAASRRAFCALLPPSPSLVVLTGRQPSHQQSHLAPWPPPRARRPCVCTSSALQTPREHCPLQMMRRCPSPDRCQGEACRRPPPLHVTSRRDRPHHLIMHAPAPMPPHCAAGPGAGPNHAAPGEEAAVLAAGARGQQHDERRHVSPELVP